MKLINLCYTYWQYQKRDLEKENKLLSDQLKSEKDFKDKLRNKLVCMFCMYLMEDATKLLFTV